MGRISELNAIIETIHFENRAKYTIAVIPLESDNRAHLIISRRLICSVDDIEKDIHNSVVVKLTTTDSNFIKTLFRLLGQFESHEFIESFRVNEQHAYFPHEIGPDPLFKKSNDINTILLESWEHIVKDRSFLAIALYYFGAWFDNLWFNKLLDKGVDSVSEWITVRYYRLVRKARRLSRYALITIQCVPSYVRIGMRQKESYSIQKKS